MNPQDKPAFLIRKIHTTLEKKANNSMKKAGLTVSQMTVLMQLSSTVEKRMTLKELEKAINLAQSTTVGIVSRLEQKGLVDYYTDVSDKRIKIVKITQAGEECCKTAKWNMNKVNDDLVVGLTDIEKDMFISILKKVSETIE